jgi:hypothetical protein
MKLERFASYKLAVSRAVVGGLAERSEDTSSAGPASERDTKCGCATDTVTNYYHDGTLRATCYNWTTPDCERIRDYYNSEGLLITDINLINQFN